MLLAVQAKGVRQMPPAQISPPVHSVSVAQGAGASQTMLALQLRSPGQASVAHEGGSAQAPSTHTHAPHSAWPVQARGTQAFLQRVAPQSVTAVSQARPSPHSESTAQASPVPAWQTFAVSSQN